MRGLFDSKVPAAEVMKPLEDVESLSKVQPYSIDFTSFPKEIPESYKEKIL